MSATVSLKRNRVYPRKFDWDEARRDHAAGVTYETLAARYGVSISAIGRVCNPKEFQRSAERRARQQRTGRCTDCGRENISSKSQRCNQCSGLARASSVRSAALRCTHCREWKHDEAFPHNRSESHRRNRHTICRPCSTLIRQKYRSLGKVPCEDCGALAEGKGRANTVYVKSLHRRVALDPRRPYLCHPCSQQRRRSKEQAA